jgi:hypothetical protein
LVEDIATRTSLDLRNADGSLMAFICPSMPDDMRKTLFAKLKGCFNGVAILEDRTSDLEDEDELEHPFFNAHFSWWNRYGVSVRRKILARFMY